MLIVLDSLYRIAFQAWISATPDHTGRESAAALRAAFVGLAGLALATFGVWVLIRREQIIPDRSGDESHSP